MKRLRNWAMAAGAVALGTLLVLALAGFGTSGENVPTGPHDLTAQATAQAVAFKTPAVCAADQTRYVDPDGHFSFCYPRAWTAAVGPPDAGAGRAVTIESGDGIPYVTMYWRPSSYFANALDDRCTVAPAWTEARSVITIVFGRNVAVCEGYENLGAESLPPLLATFAEVPREAGGFISTFWYRPEGAAYAADSEAVGMLLDSVRFDD